MVIGISTASFFTKLTTENASNIIKELGFKCCEVFLTTFREYLPEFGDLLKENYKDLEVYSVHSLNQHYEPELFNVVERTREDSEYFFRQVSNIANKLSAKYYTFHGPARLKRTPYILNYNWIANRINYLNSLLAEITNNTCKLAYENVHWTYFNEPSFFEKLRKLSSIDACLDIKQAMQSKVEINQYIDVMKDRLKNVHLCDFDTSGKLAIPGKGCFDFVGLFCKLINIGYSGPLIIEVYPSDYSNFSELSDSKVFLENCLAEAKSICGFKTT